MNGKNTLLALFFATGACAIMFLTMNSTIALCLLLICALALFFVMITMEPTPPIRVRGVRRKVAATATHGRAHADSGLFRPSIGR